ncbi:MAG: prepilin-type N-terminal cleavage/methylation domain-containing protein [Fimbriimonadaceae bacterium]|nr:prepilin-type N-terminal cleavage/methylation domain-containing protein [Chthonomonadaceae bacterium]MCO5296523.1 prepilin-type N-terminal cleavage/methylation domain-containing protein [Fimbriimonadaceae bacterium]
MKKAFTLIELLVVIAIIAILAAILFPVFAQVKAAAKKTMCISNGKQIGIALYLYVGDYDDSLPMANYPNTFVGPPFTEFGFDAGAGAGEPAWADLIQPYSKNLQIFKCPVDDSGTPGNVPGAPLSYGLNYYFYKLRGGVSRFSLTGGSMSEIATPASKIYIAETASGSGREILRPDRYLGFERHSGGSTYIYADTHARYHKMPQWWKDIPSSVWGTPEQAELQPCPQWFPWLDTSTELW